MATDSFILQCGDMARKTLRVIKATKQLEEELHRFDEMVHLILTPDEFNLYRSTREDS